MKQKLKSAKNDAARGQYGAGFLYNILQVLTRKFIAAESVLILVLFFSGSGISGASEVSLNASVVPEKASIGQPLTYSLIISGIDPAALNITLPEKKVVFPDTGSDKEKNNRLKSSVDKKTSEEFVPLYIINNALRDESELNGVKQVSIKILLSYYRPGSHTLPEIRIAGSDGVAIGYKIPAVMIEEINKEGTLEEIEPPVSLSGNYSRIIWILIAVLILAAAIFFLIRYMKKRSKTLIHEEPSLPPLEIFLAEVKSLKPEELISQGRINEYVFDISIIFRRYLSAMFKFDAAEMTTDEIAVNIKKFMPAELYSVFGEEIINNMRLWDFSKFAEFTPSSDLLLENLDATVSAAKKLSGYQRQDGGSEAEEKTFVNGNPEAPDGQPTGGGR